MAKGRFAQPSGTPRVNSLTGTGLASGTLSRVRTLTTYDKQTQATVPWSHAVQLFGCIRRKRWMLSAAFGHYTENTIKLRQAGQIAVIARPEVSAKCRHDLFNVKTVFGGHFANSIGI